LLFPSLDGQMDDERNFLFFLFGWSSSGAHTCVQESARKHWQHLESCRVCVDAVWCFSPGMYVCMDGWCPSESLCPPLCLNHTVIDVVAQSID
jgi:hypothetical protein